MATGPGKRPLTPVPQQPDPDAPHKRAQSARQVPNFGGMTQPLRLGRTGDIPASRSPPPNLSLHGTNTDRPQGGLL